MIARSVEQPHCASQTSEMSISDPTALKEESKKSVDVQEENSSKELGEGMAKALIVLVLLSVALICAMTIYVPSNRHTSSTEGENTGESPDIAMDPLEINIEELQMPGDGTITTEHLSQVLKQRGVKLVHGIKGNRLLPMLKLTNFEMLNVFDLLKHGSCPMTGELEDSIDYDTGKSLQRLSFVDLSDVQAHTEGANGDFWKYAHAQYPKKGHLNKDGFRDRQGDLVAYTFLEETIELICHEILKSAASDTIRKDNLLVKLSIAVTRLRLYHPNGFSTFTRGGARFSGKRLDKLVEDARKPCLDSMEQYISDLKKAIALCDDPDLNVPEKDSFSDGAHFGEKDKMLMKKILSTFDTKLDINRFKAFAGQQRSKFHIMRTTKTFFQGLIDELQSRNIEDDVIFRLDHELLTECRAHIQSPCSDYAILFNVPEWTILIRRFPKMVPALQELDESMLEEVRKEWKTVLINTLRHEEKMLSVLGPASDPEGNSHIRGLYESEKTFIVRREGDIPMVIGTTSHFEENDRNHMKFGSDIDVLVVEERNVEAVKAYLEREYDECSGRITIYAIKGNYALQQRSGPQPPTRVVPPEGPWAHYRLLDVPRNATPKQIRRKYKKLALQWHPDKHHDEEEKYEDIFKRLQDAYEVLRDPSRRQSYDLMCTLMCRGM